MPLIAATVFCGSSLKNQQIPAIVTKVTPVNLATIRDASSARDTPSSNETIKLGAAMRKTPVVPSSIVVVISSFLMGNKKKTPCLFSGQGVLVFWIFCYLLTSMCTFPMAPSNFAGTE